MHQMAQEGVLLPSKLASNVINMIFQFVCNTVSKPYPNLENTQFYATIKLRNLIYLKM